MYVNCFITVPKAKERVFVHISTTTVPNAFIGSLKKSLFSIILVSKTMEEAATTGGMQPETAALQEDSRKVNLVSMDGDSFEVSQSVACMSELVKTLIAGALPKVE